MVELTDEERYGLQDLSRSYPFLDLSRRFGVSYGKVLKAAELIDGGALAPHYLGRDSDRVLRVANATRLSTEQVTAVAAVCAAPWRWQFPPKVVGRGIT